MAGRRCSALNLSQPLAECCPQPFLPQARLRGAVITDKLVLNDHIQYSHCQVRFIIPRIW